MKMISPMMSAAINVPVLEGTSSSLSLSDSVYSRAVTSHCFILISVTPATSRENSCFLSWLNLTILSSILELPWDIWRREASFWLHSPSCSSLLGLLRTPTPFGLIQFSHLATVAGNPGISVSQSRQRRRHSGFPGRWEWGHLYRESSRSSGISSVNMSDSPLRSPFPSERCFSRLRHW